MSNDALRHGRQARGIGPHSLVRLQVFVYLFQDSHEPVLHKISIILLGSQYIGYHVRSFNHNKEGLPVEAVITLNPTARRISN